MSDDEPFPSFAGSGDAREEALWQAYQAMLRRRKVRQAGAAVEGVRGAPPLAETEAPPPADGPLRRPDPSRSARQSPLTAADPPPPAAAPRGRTTTRQRALIGGAVLLAAGATLAIALWPRGSDPSRPTATDGRSDPRAAGSGAGATPRPTLPCFVDGQSIGRLTLDDCASRNGVASGPLYAGQAGPPVPRPGDSLRGAVVSIPTAAAGPPPASARDVTLPSPGPRAGPGAGYSSPPHGVSRASADVIGEAPPGPRPPPENPGRSERPAAPVPGAEPSAPAGAGVYSETRPPAMIPPARASVLAVREFYGALGDGDGARAAAVVVPEKRQDGPLSAGALTRFYSSLRAPLRLTRVDPIDDDTVQVRYQYVAPDNRLCSGSATVATTHRDGDTLVRGIRAADRC